jgi:hypothetical protein
LRGHSLHTFATYHQVTPSAHRNASATTENVFCVFTLLLLPEFPLFLPNKQLGAHRLHQQHTAASMLQALIDVWTVFPMQEFMLVTNAKGQVCHISSSLADMLGRTRQQALANNSHHVVEQLMVKPFGHMHRALLQVGAEHTALVHCTTTSLALALPTRPRSK